MEIQLFLNLLTSMYFSIRFLAAHALLPVRRLPFRLHRYADVMDNEVTETAITKRNLGRSFFLG
jgi:hypothetical protein